MILYHYIVIRWSSWEASRLLIMAEVSSWSCVLYNCTYNKVGLCNVDVTFAVLGSAPALLRAAQPCTGRYRACYSSARDCLLSIPSMWVCTLYYIHQVMSALLSLIPVRSNTQLHKHTIPHNTHTSPRTQQTKSHHMSPLDRIVTND